MDYQPWSAEAERDLAREVHRRSEVERYELMMALDGLLQPDPQPCDYEYARAVIARAKGE